MSFVFVYVPKPRFVSTPLIPINTKSTSIDYQVIDILMRLP